jgi:hypothetical protein
MTHATDPEFGVTATKTEMVEIKTEETPCHATTSTTQGHVDETTRAQRIRNKVTVLRYLGRVEEKLDQVVGVETQGIDRIPDEKRKPPSLLNAFLLWFSFNGHIATLPVGLLGPEFGLSLKLSLVAIVVGTLLGAFFPAYCATLGPKVSKSHPAN